MESLLLHLIISLRNYIRGKETSLNGKSLGYITLTSKGDLDIIVMTLIILEVLNEFQQERQRKKGKLLVKKI